MVSALCFYLCIVYPIIYYRHEIKNQVRKSLVNNTVQLLTAFRHVPKRPCSIFIASVSAKVILSVTIMWAMAAVYRFF